MADSRLDLPPNKKRMCPCCPRYEKKNECHGVSLAVTPMTDQQPHALQCQGLQASSAPTHQGLKQQFFLRSVKRVTLVRVQISPIGEIAKWLMHLFTRPGFAVRQFHRATGAYWCCDERTYNNCTYRCTCSTRVPLHVQATCHVSYCFLLQWRWTNTGASGSTGVR